MVVVMGHCGNHSRISQSRVQNSGEKLCRGCVKEEEYSGICGVVREAVAGETSRHRGDNCCGSATMLCVSCL